MTKKIDVPSIWSGEMASVVAKQDELSANLYAPGQSIQEMRDAYTNERKFWNDCGPDVVVTVDETITTPYGDIDVRMYRPNSDPTLPLIVYTHGGGMVLGNLDTHDRITRKISQSTGAAVVAVDYTLSPEAKYPQAIEETVAVVEYLRANSDDWGINPDDVSFAGDSGGAHLALATYVYLQNNRGATPWVSSLLLFYGMYGLRDSVSLRTLGGPWDGLSEADLQMYLSMYLPDDFGSNPNVDTQYYDLLSTDFTPSMAPCFVLGVALDPLRDDSRALADLLGAAGCRHEFQEIDGVIHGFLHHGRMLAATDEALNSAAAFYLDLQNKGE